MEVGERGVTGTERKSKEVEMGGRGGGVGRGGGSMQKVEMWGFFFPAKGGIRGCVRSRWVGGVY